MARSTTTIEDIHPDVLTCALRHMDGRTLSSVTCATTHLRTHSTHPSIWRDLCLSTWPSLRSHPHLIQSHRSFFSDSFPFPPIHPTLHVSNDLPTELISAVDIYHRGNPVFSRVIKTDTSTPWFLGSPLRIDALDRKDPPPPHQHKSQPSDDLMLSWILIDPIGRRAVNVSSRCPVAVDRHWYTGETLVRFGLVINGIYNIGVVVTCGEENGHVREVSLVIEDVDGIGVGGRDGLVILKGVMDGGRSGKEIGFKGIYEEFLRRKWVRKERKERREGVLDFCCTFLGVLVFFGFLMVVAFR